MMKVLLVLSACFCVGFSYDEEEYGKTHRMRLLRKAHSIEFHPLHSSNVTILWKRDEPSAREDSRRKEMGSYFVITKLTPKDNGQYIMRDRDQRVLSTSAIRVVANMAHHTLNPGESLSISFDLEKRLCNIFFFPKHDYDLGNNQIVRHGWLQRGDSDCQGFTLLEPCGILNEDLQMSCSGNFEVRDQDGNRALLVSLEMEPNEESEDHYDASSIGIGVGTFCAIVSCCTCVRRCCCGKSSSKKDTTETPDAEPAVHYHEYTHEPVGPRREHQSQPSGTQYPAQPSYTATDPLIHKPPTTEPPTTEPPAYSEVSAPAEQADTPTIPVSFSEPEPRFELKGITFPSTFPLSSDSSHSDVYTSDKLTFRSMP